MVQYTFFYPASQARLPVCGYFWAMMCCIGVIGIGYPTYRYVGLTPQTGGWFQKKAYYFSPLLPSSLSSIGYRKKNLDRTR
ncbi:MAG TPA: hypothetical protein PK112_08805, partial [candidate division Zixibacteria bacterium]|nr:hypothetical protein [candidate division Zixibacteria bacterium]